MHPANPTPRPASPGPPRILHVSQPVDAGVAVVLAELAAHQSRLGWEVHVACPPQGWLLHQLAEHPITVHAWAADRSPGPASLLETARLARVLRRVQPHVVHLHSAKAGLAGRLAVRGRVPTVFQPHAWSFHASGGRMRPLTTWWERSALRWTDLLIAVSADELEEGRAGGLTPRHSVVVPNGVDIERFSPRDRTAARRRLGLPEDAPLALCLGRLARQKGQDLLLSAWPEVRRRAPGAHLALVGDGPERARLAGVLPSGVSLHGSVARPEDWYAAADVVVLPSRWEGMALVPLEAMACGRPVVGFAVAGMAESIGDAGVTLPPGDLDALAAAVAERLTDPERAHAEGHRGRARAVSRYDRRQAWELGSAAVSELLEAGGRVTVARPTPRRARRQLGASSSRSR